MKKIIFSDYDGTIYTKHGDLAPNLAAIREWRALGGKFVIATGRGFASTQEVVNEYAIPFDYLIMNNGALIADQNRQIIAHTALDPTRVQQITAQIRQQFGSQLDTFYYYGLSEKSTAMGEIVTKLMVRTKGRERQPALAVVETIRQHYPEILVHASWTDPYPLEQFPEMNFQVVEAVNAAAGKENAAHAILAREQLTPADATAIGDGANDLAMIQHYDGYAIAGSPAADAADVKTAKSLASIITQLIGLA